VKILFLSSWYPFPPNNGSKLRIYNLLRGLSKEHKITLLSFIDQPDINLDSPEIHSVCQNVQVVKDKPFRSNSLNAYLGYLSLCPRSVVDSFSKEMQKCIERQIATRSYDLIIASQTSMARYCRAIHNVPILIEEVEVGMLFDQFNQASSSWLRFRKGLTWFKYRNYLAHLLHSSSACTVVSEQERQLIIRNVPCHALVEVVPNCIQLSDYQNVNESPQPNALIFTGSFRYHANYEAMIWFLTDVFPIIRAEIPDVNLVITGDHAGLPLPSSKGVILTGFIDDIRHLVARSSVSLAPIRIGGGTRLKILEAMALRTPVVSTQKGAEGLEVTDGKNILIADSPAQYAKAVCRLLHEPELRNRIVDNAYQLVTEKYNWSVVIPRFLKLIENIPPKRQSYEYEPDTI
jgi:glycosyltransferase involved in cell wall biosynthesis